MMRSDWFIGSLVRWFIGSLIHWFIELAITSRHHHAVSKIRMGSNKVKTGGGGHSSVQE